MRKHPFNEQSHARNPTNKTSSARVLSTSFIDGLQVSTAPNNRIIVTKAPAFHCGACERIRYLSRWKLSSHFLPVFTWKTRLLPQKRVAYVRNFDETTSGDFFDPFTLSFGNSPSLFGRNKVWKASWVVVDTGASIASTVYSILCFLNHCVQMKCLHVLLRLLFDPRLCIKIFTVS